MFTAIITAIDGSDASTKALDTAASIAKIYGAQLHILNVPQDETTALVMSGVGGYVPMTPTIPFEDLKAAGEQIVSKAREYCDNLEVANVTTHVRVGSAAQEVLSLADEVNADLIVTGRRGLGGFASLLLGSTSHAILNGAECACLSVP